MSRLYNKQRATTLMLLLIMSCFRSVRGELMLSPSGVAFACVGIPLEIACSTTSTVLQWNITYNAGPETISEARLVYHSARAATLSPFMAHRSTVYFTRTSKRNTLPLTASLLIDPVTEGLNQTMISCRQLGSSVNAQEAAALTIVDQHYGPPDVSIQDVEKSEQFWTDGFTLTVNWTQESDQYPLHYDINILPHQGAIIRFVDDTRIELTVQYNVSFNISITTSLCNQTLASTTYSLPVYTRAPSFCHVPVLQSNILTTMNYSQPLVEGSILGFVCSSGLTLSGPKTTTCLSNGQWIPNPDLAECKVNCGPPSFSRDSYIIPYASTLEGTTVTYICYGNQSLFQATAVCTKMGHWEPSINRICTIEDSVFTDNTLRNSSDPRALNQAGRIAVASLITVLVVASVLLFIIGYLCGLCHRKKKTETSESPLYDNVQPQQNIESDLELKDNVAYEHVHMSQN